MASFKRALIYCRAPAYDETKMAVRYHISDISNKQSLFSEHA